MPELVSTLLEIVFAALVAAGAALIGGLGVGFVVAGGLGLILSWMAHR